MQIKSLFKDFNKLQQIHGEKTLDSVFGCGQIKNPNLCLVFMNPTARNVSTSKSWKGLKAPWIGTKNVWQMFHQLSLFDDEFIKEISSKNPSDWDDDFALLVYEIVCSKSMYITNLSKATQIDARHLSDAVFREYIELFKKEIDEVKPKVIIAFGAQVSSVLLGKNISLSEYRKKHDLLKINGFSYKVFPVYYPVGQGRRNIGIAKEDILWIIKNFIK